ncbi:MAG: thioredoxin family protein [Acidobacteriota bacterium]|nr:thioredoxin family protein [Acidobacteriota bacterium]
MPRMKLRATRVRISRLCAIWILCLLPVPASARQASRPAASDFPPLQQWKSAIVNHNQSALVSLYSAVPPAVAKIPQGTAHDPSEEPRFWELLESDGLADFNPKILQIERPQPDVAVLTLRIEMKLRSKSGPQPAIVEAAQLWEQQDGGWRILRTQRTDPAPDPNFQLPQPANPDVNLYPPPREARAEIAAALKSAATDHKRVILVFGANWCYDCHVLNSAFHAPGIAPLVSANYHVVHINIGEGDKNLDLADEYGVPLHQVVRVPSLAVLEWNGKVIYSQKNGEFDDSARLSPADIVQFLKKWAPPRNE